MMQRTTFETKLKHYDTVPVPDCMREELERPTPSARVLKRLYKYYNRKIPKPIPLLRDENELSRVRFEYTRMLKYRESPWVFDFKMKRLKREIKEVWENKGGKEDDKHLDDNAEEDKHSGSVICC